MSDRHRRCIVLEGSPLETLKQAVELTSRLEPATVLWVVHRNEDGDRTRHTESGIVSPRKARSLLGRSFSAVILDAHDGLDPDLLAICHGFVLGGGALVLRLGKTLPAPDPTLAALPFGPTDVGLRFERRARQRLAPFHTDITPLTPPPHIPAGTAEQAALVQRLVDLVLDHSGPIAITADRGRGKSSALGLALAEIARRRPTLSFVITADDPDAVRETFRFFDGTTDNLELHPRWRFLEALLSGPTVPLVVIDEAARVPVPVLNRLAERHPRLLCLTTVHGYEGTGRGFVLRFLARLERRLEPTAPLHRLTLSEPIRWSSGCPLERLVSDLLLLSAEPAPLDDTADDTTFEILDRQALSSNDARLGDLFGLLVHAHYRTTPGDLMRLLDAPNLAIHAAVTGRRIIAACLVAFEGGLAPELCARVAAGKERLRAHALADALVAHLGETDAGSLRMVRSVRIATHPGLRRKGLARQLVEHVHASYRVDLFGTLFGADSDLIAFRRSLGYRVVRVSASRNARTGEPSVMMLRPVSDAARRLVEHLESELAQELPAQLELLESDGILFDDGLAESLGEDLPSVALRSPEEDEACVLAYLESPRTFEAHANTIARWVKRHRQALDALPPEMRTLLEARVLSRLSWPEAQRLAGLPTIPAAMRLLRRALRAMAEEKRSFRDT